MADVGKMDRNLALEAVRVTEAAALVDETHESAAGQDEALFRRQE